MPGNSLPMISAKGALSSPDWGIARGNQLPDPSALKARITFVIRAIIIRVMPNGVGLTRAFSARMVYASCPPWDDNPPG
jgi:hypothetical protein